MIRSYTTPVRGMACRQCERAVAVGLACVPGVLGVQARYADGTVSVRYDAASCTPNDVARRLDALGYPVGEGRKGRFYDAVFLALAVLALLFLQLVDLPAAPKAEGGAPLPWLFAVGLLTGIHCIAMCGGIMLSQVMGASVLGETGGARASGRVRRVLPATLHYNVGRVFSYTAVGALFGGVGSAIAYGAPVKAGVLAVAGILVALMGLRMLGLAPRFRLPRFRRERPNPTGHPWLVGLATGLMPCGALASMWLLAAGSGSAVQGALTMLAFVVGTVPLMVAFGSFGALLPRSWMKYAVGASAALVLAFGVSMAINGAKLLLSLV